MGCPGAQSSRQSSKSPRFTTKFSSCNRFPVDKFSVSGKEVDMKSGKDAGGYSLYELVMTLGLVAVLLGVGIPSLGALAADKRLRVEVDALFHAIYLARTESIARRRVVTICPSIDGRYCNPGYDWSGGWIVFVNKGLRNSLQRADDEQLLRHHQVSETSRIMSNRQGFSLRSTELRATNGTLIFCDRASRTQSRALVVSYTGRPRVTRKDRRGNPYDCAG
jgi:type IV fimbrial biogenesis protein FimT